MKKHIRVLSALFALLLLLISVSCGSADQKTPDNTPAQTTQAPSTTAPSPETSTSETPTPETPTPETSTPVVTPTPTVTKKLRVASFNIQNGSQVGYNFKNLAKAILNSGAEIIGLQEVDINTGRNGGKDTMALLSEYTGYEYHYFSKSIDFSGGQYGNGILSKYPILSFEEATLPKGGGDETRSYGHAVIDVDGVKIDFFNTHLTLNDSSRPDQWSVLAKEFKKCEHPILTGDLNRDGTEDYDLYFTKTCNYANGNNLIGFTEGCTVVRSDKNAEVDHEAQKAAVTALYGLKNGEKLEGTYSLTGKVFGLVNTYPGSDDVTFRIIVEGLNRMPVKCFKVKDGGKEKLEIGDVVTVTGTLQNLITASEYEGGAYYYDSCPGWGSLDNIISSSFFTQTACGIEDRRPFSDHYLLWADLEFQAPASGE